MRPWYGFVVERRVNVEFGYDSGGFGSVGPDGNRRRTFYIRSRRRRTARGGNVDTERDRTGNVPKPTRRSAVRTGLPTRI